MTFIGHANLGRRVPQVGFSFESGPFGWLNILIPGEAAHPVFLVTGKFGLMRSGCPVGSSIVAATAKWHERLCD